jgi:hypothetical protein
MGHTDGNSFDGANNMTTQHFRLPSLAVALLATTATLATLNGILDYNAIAKATLRQCTATLTVTTPPRA